MKNTLYVGNLPFNLSVEELTDFFAAHGQVVSAKIVQDHNTGRSKGFGFVEMSNESEAQVAMEKSDGAEMQGRNIKVSLANEKKPGGGGGDRPRRPGGGGREGGPGGGGGGNRFRGGGGGRDGGGGGGRDGGGRGPSRGGGGNY